MLSSIITNQTSFYGRNQEFFYSQSVSNVRHYGNLTLDSISKVKLLTGALMLGLFPIANAVPQEGLDALGLLSNTSLFPQCGLSPFSILPAIENTCSAIEPILSLFRKECPDYQFSNSLLATKNVKSLHPNEAKAKEMFGTHILEIDSQDPRPKALYLVSSENGSEFGFKRRDKPFFLFPNGYEGSDSHISTLDETHDVLYKTISSPDDICSSISAAAKAGKVKTLVLFAHGSAFRIYLPEKNMVRNGDKLAGIPENCFSELDSRAEVTLISCETGSLSDGIASTLSKIANRTVWAPRSIVTPQGVEFSSSIPAYPKIYTMWGASDLACKFTPNGLNECQKYDGSKLLKAVLHPDAGMSYNIVSIQMNALRIPYNLFAKVTGLRSRHIENIGTCMNWAILGFAFDSFLFTPYSAILLWRAYRQRSNLVPD